MIYRRIYNGIFMPEVRPKFEKTLWEKIKLNKASYVLMAPYLIFFFVFTLLPIIITFFLSFTHFNMLQPPQWLGWANFERLLLDDDVFLIAVRNTLVFGFITGPLSYFICVLFAWFINDLGPKIRTFVTLLFYAPSISGNLFVIWAFIFSGDTYGLVNGLLMKWGMIREPVQWLNDPKYNLTIIIIVQLWLSLGAGFLAFIAGLQSVDKSLYEAGSVDGIKNRWQELWYITLPSMVPQLMFGAVMQIITSFTLSDVSMSLAGFPSTKYSAHTIPIHIIDYGMVRYEMGYASALAVVLLLGMVILNKVIFALLRRISND